MNRNPEVERYVAGAPEALREDLEWLRAQIRHALPFSEEMFQSKMPVYVFDGKWVAGFAYRAKGVMFYAMEKELLDARAAELGKNRSGNSCVEFRATKALPMERLRELALAILGEIARKYS